MSAKFLAVTLIAQVAIPTSLASEPICRLASSSELQQQTNMPALSANAKGYTYHYGLNTCVVGPGDCDEFKFRVHTPPLAEPYINSTDSVLLASLQNNPSINAIVDCRRMPLKRGLESISSSTWIKKRSQIMIVDTFQGKSFLFSTSGTQQAGLMPFADSGLASVVTLPKGKGYLVSDLNYKATIYDNDLRRVDGVVDLLKTANGKGRGVGSLYEWVVAGKYIFGYGPSETDIEKLGLFRLPMQSQSDGDGQMLLPLNRFEFYALGHKYFAATDDTVFFLAMDERPYIYKASGNGSGYGRRLKSFPREFQNVPNLTVKQTGPAQTEKVFAEVEARSLPVGIYAKGRFIYVLARSPLGDGKTAWWLYQIDHENDSINQDFRLRLPTSTNHLELTPGQDIWYIFEKGKRTKGPQQINGMISIPQDWITSPKSSPLRRAISTEELCESLPEGRPQKEIAQ